MDTTTVLTGRRLCLSLALAAVTIFAFAIAGPLGLANAADIKVLSARALKGSFQELAPQFEKTTGHKLVLEFGTGAALIRKIDAGETFDVAILSPKTIDGLIEQGKVAPDSRAKLGRMGVGVAARKGAPKPDTSSVEAFKRAMLDAKSVAYSKAGRTRKVLFAAIERLGIAGDMKPKLKPHAKPEQAVAAGEAELGVTGIGAILAVSGAELVGGFPPEIQSYLNFAAGAGAGSSETEANRALIHFLSGPDAARVLKAHGIDPR